MLRTTLPLVLAWVLVSCSPVESREPEPAARPSGAFAALSWWSEMRAYPQQDIPRAGIANAFAQKTSARKGIDPSMSPWVPIGPHNLAGRMLAVAFNPERSATLLAGSASGGLWRSYSAGEGAAAWHRVETGFPIMAVSTIAYAPGDSNTIYLGTGEVYLRGGPEDRGLTYRVARGSYGLGIIVSRDGGATWHKSLDWSAEQRRGVQMIKVNPLRPATVWAATSEGLYRSYNSGESWSLVHNVVMGTDLAIHASDTTKIFSAHGNFGSAGAGIYRSANGGTDWVRLQGGLPVTYGGKALIDIALSDPEIIYASIGYGHRNTDGNSLMRSADAGDTWETVQIEDYVGYQGWYSHDVSVHPQDPDRITIVGFLIHLSSDGGRSMVAATEWPGWTNPQPPVGGPDGEPNYTHPDHHAITRHASDPDLLLFATDGGIYRTRDGGQTFRSLNGGLQTIQFYPGISNSLHETNTALAGTQDNSTLVYSGSPEWRILEGGDGAWTSIDPVDPNQFFWSSQVLYMERSSDRGLTMQSVAPPDRNRFTSFIAPFVQSRADPQVIYAGRDRVYISRDQGDSWTVGNGGAVLTGEPIVTMAASETDPNVAYLVTAPYLNFRARVFATADGGEFWSDMTGSLPDRYLVDIAVDPRDDQRLFLTVGGFGSDHVYRSDDGGGDWVSAAAGLPDLPTWSVAIDPDFPERIFAGNDIGVYVSEDSGVQWEVFSSGLPEAVIAMDLDVSRLDRILRVATHGNGMYQRNLDEQVGVDPPQVASSVGTFLSVYPNPADQLVTATIQLQESRSMQLSIYDSSGRLVRVVFDGVGPAGRTFHRISVPDLPQAVYYLRLESGSLSTTSSFAISR